MGEEASATLGSRLTVDAQAVDASTPPGVFFRQAERYGDRVLFRHWQNDRWLPETWNSMRRRVLSAAAALLEAGVQPGDRVIIFSANCVEWLVCDLAIASVAGVTVPIYPSTIAETAQLIADNSQAVIALVSDGDTAKRLKTGKQLKRVVQLDDEFQAWMAKPRGERLDEIQERLEKIRPDELATIIYTSGTTGEPKGVMLTHSNLYEVGKRSVEVLGLTDSDVSLSFLPYAHSFERIAVMAGVIAGASGWLSRGKDKLSKDLQETKPTLFPSVPMIYEKMYRLVFEEAGQQSERRQQIFRWAIDVAHKRLDAKRVGPALAARHALADFLVLRSIRRRLSGGNVRFFVSGGAPLGEQIERFFWALDIKILQGWGLTETSATATVNTPQHHKFGTVGRPIPDVELKIAEDGEILLKSPGLMQGYFRNEKSTNEVMQDGWFKTGDIGELDSDGFLKITDRKKDLIKTASGKYVAPQGIEARLQNEHGIERVVVIGDERPYVTALIVPNYEELRREGISADPKELPRNDHARQVIQKSIDKVNSQLDKHESVQYFEILERDLDEESGELTPTLKPKRRVITENYKDLIEGMYQNRKRPADGEAASAATADSNGSGSRQEQSQKAEAGAATPAQE